MRNTRGAVRMIWFAALVAGLAVAGLVASKRGDWGKVYVPAGHRLIAGENIFQHRYVYPPFQALVAAPFAAMPPSASRVLWASLNAFAAGVFILSAWRLTGGTRPWRDKPEPGEWWIFALGIAAAVGFIFDAITNGQTDLLIAAFITSGCLLLPRSSAGGGGMLGLAAAAKCTPLLFVPWLVWRRRWMATSFFLLAALVANLLPDVIFPSAEGVRLLRWGENFFTPLFNQSYIPGTWFTALEFNHSLAGALRRLSPAAAVRSVLLLSAGTLLLLAAFAMRRSHVQEETRGSLIRERFEIGMIVCLMLLLSPASSKPHFCILLLPAWAVARTALMRNNCVLLSVSILAALAGLVANKTLVGAAVYDAAKWWGVITLETLLLFFACFGAQLRGRNSQTSADEYIDLRREGR